MSSKQIGVLVLDEQGARRAENNFDEVLQSGADSAIAFVNCLPEEVDVDLQGFIRFLEEESQVHWTHEEEGTGKSTLSFVAYRAASGETIVVVERATGESGDHSQPFPLDQGFRTVLDQSGHSIVVTDTSGTITYANPRIAETTGYTPDELLGENPKVFQSGHHSDEFYEDLWDTILSGEIWTGEIRNKRKDGTEYVLDQTIAPLKDDNDEITGFIAMNRDVTEKSRKRELLKRRVEQDPLLEIPGQEAAVKQVDEQFCQHPDRYGTFYIVSLNNYSRLEDVLALDVFFHLMTEFKNRVETCCTDDDVLGKITDREIAVFTSRFDTIESAEDYGQDLLRETSKAFLSRGTSYHLDVDIGFSHRQCSETTPESLLDEAQKALLAARNQDESRCQIYLPEYHEIREKKLQHLQLEERLREGIAEQEFVPFFQPIVDLNTGTVSGLEALMRWDHPENGILSPYSFIEHARGENLLKDIETQIMRQALTVIHDVVETSGRTSLDIHLNVEPSNFGAGDVLNRLQKCLDGRSISPEQVHVEVVESEELRDWEAIHELKSLTEHGFGVSVDDFGTGYSSLNYLMNVPADTVKIDRSLIMEIDEDHPTNPVLSAVVSMIQNLERDIVAEGVETPFQHQVLNDFEVNYGQGYLYARPMPADDLERFLERFDRSEFV